MAFCDFCKAEGQKTGTCAYCGTVYYTAGVTFIYGQTEKESYGSEFRLTDKYFIVRSVSKAEMAGNVTAGAAFGLIGALAATAVDSARKKNYGFYDLQELQKVIYPYHTNSLKKDTAFKFVNKDGSDFVLNFNLNGLFSGKAAKNFADTLVKVGIYVENGAGTQYPFCCMNPFVNQTTFGTRVCPSAATFVKMTDQQFIAQPISNIAQTQQPVQQPVQPTYQAPPVQPVQSVPVQPIQQQIKIPNNSGYYCNLCKNPAISEDECPYCGKTLGTFKAKLIYGYTKKESVGCELKFTDKYLAVKTLTKASSALNSVAVASLGAATFTTKNSKTITNDFFAFYDYNEMQKIVYPFECKQIKNEAAMKIVNKDGTDFVVILEFHGVLGMMMVIALVSSLENNICIEDGSKKRDENVCFKPFLNPEIAGRRVCPSAATFVKMTDQQFIAQPISNVAQAPQQPTYSQPVQQPVYQEPPVQPVQQAPVQPVKSVESTPVSASAPAVDTSAWQSAWQTPVAAANVEEKKPEQIMCPTCGSMNSATARFCSKCGTAFATQQQSSFSVDDWKNKW